MQPITLNGDWVQSVKDSIPDHSKDIKLNIDAVINRSGLDPVDTHAIAYVSALAAGNGGLAFEIEHNSPLFLAEAEREAAKTAASLMGQNNIWYPFVEMAADEEATKAIEMFDGQELEGRKLTVNEARPMQPREDRGGFGGGNRF